MYTVVYLSSVNGVWSVQSYGPFATWAAADAWQAANLLYGIGIIVENYNPVPSTPNGPLTPTALLVGQWAAYWIGVDQSGVYRVYSFGPYTTQVSAQAFVNTQFGAASYAVAQVVAPPS